MGKRTERRIQASVPVQIGGGDARGQTFEDSTEALDISRRGISVLTERDLPLYTSLTVVIPDRGSRIPNQGPSDFFTTAAVVQVQKEGEMSRVVIRFVEATLLTHTSEIS